MATPRDVIVIGAGIVGCAVAYELALRGVSVEIVDERPAGMGATQASAGVLGPFVEAREEGPLLELTSRSLDLFAAFVPAVEAESGLSIPYKRTGTLDVASSAERMTTLEAEAQLLERRGVQAQLLDARAVREAEPLLPEDAAGGLLIPSHGFVAAGELTRALIAGAQRRGARLAAPRQVTRVVSRRSTVDLETDGDPMSAGAVVVAAGSWASQIEVAGAMRAPVRPVRGQLLEVAWDRQPLRRVTWGDNCYLVPWDDGRLLVGATVEDAGFDQRNTVAGVHDLIDAAAELIPHVWTAGFTAARAGLRPASADLLPIVGASSVAANVFYATGHYRNGVLLSPLTAQVLASLIVDEARDPALALMRPDRFGAL